jgi:ribosomal protein S18 acetylase RimI-like enzyme
MEITRTKKHFIAGLAFIGVIAVSLTIYWTAREHMHIVKYNGATHRQQVLKLFEDNWSWLISSPDYSAEHMLDTQSSSKAPENYGNLTSYVYEIDHNVVGFTAFYEKSFYKAQILFLVVDEKIRRQGIAEKLLRFDLQQLKKAHYTVIELVTKVTNTRAQSLYQKVGFKEIWRDDNFIRYQIRV